MATAALAVAGCAADGGEFNIRAVADPLTRATRAGNSTVAEARGLLALGNVGLALEAFRKALREQPASLEALAGIAECYERMGRYDLSRRYYESALAVAPRNAVLLNTFAASLHRQGRVAEAAAVRAEAAADAGDVAALATAGPEEPVTVAQWKIEPQPAFAAQSVTVILPPARKSEAAPPKALLQVAPPAPGEPAVPVKQQAAVPRPAATIAERKETPDSRSVTVPLPPARVAETASPMRTPQAAEPAAAEPTAVATQPVVDPKPAAAVAERKKMPASAPSLPAVLPKPDATRPQPRLERLSPGEVALLTRDQPVWKARVVAQTRQSVTVRFVALKTASLRPNIRLLNAARRQGLAARTRNLLINRGWRRIEIGDAPQVRTRSLVLYPPDKQIIGRRLAAQFGFRSALSKRGNELVVLLGRDAPAARFRSPG